MQLCSSELIRALDAHLAAVPSVLPSSERRELIGSIDKTIGALEHAIRALREKRNECAHANRLPDELLELIFYYTITVKHGSRTCVNPSHVCRRWHHVALSSSRLWSHIVTTKWKSCREGMDVFIRRTATVPLSLDVDFEDPDAESEAGSDLDEWPSASATPEDEPTHPNTVSLMLSQIHRIRSLRISLNINHVAEFSREKLQSMVAPQLQALFVNFQRDQPLRPMIEDNEVQDKMVSFLSADFPALRVVHVELPDVMIALPLLRPTVVHLHLSALVLAFDVEPPDFLGALRGMPLLKTIKLINVFSDGPLNNTPQRHLVSFPHLQYLLIADSKIPCITELLDSIELPPDVHMEFRPFGGHRDISEQDTSALGRKLAPFLNSLTRPRDRDIAEEAITLRATFQLMQDTSRRTFHGVHFWTRPTSQDAPRLTIGLPPIGDLHHCVNIMGAAKALWTALPLHRVDKIELFSIPTHYVSSLILWHMDLMLQCMSDMKTAQTITLWRWNAYWLRELLAERFRVGFMPHFSVKTLVLEEMALGSAWPKRSHAEVTVCAEDEDELEASGGIEAVFKENSTEILKTELRKWQEKRGRPLDEVVFKDCYGMTEEEILSLDLGCATVRVVTSS